METLPLEMWEHVFEKLECNDCISVYNTCEEWKGLLESTKTSWRFSQILPFLLKYLSKRDILLCRSICKRWSQSVDTFVENRNSPFHPNLEDMTSLEAINRQEKLNSIISNRKLDYVSFGCEPEPLLKFLHEAENHPRCPFVAKAVRISFSSRPPISLYSMQLLQMYGHHVVYFHLTMRRSPTPVGYLTRLMNILIHVPNLKKLYIYGSHKYLRNDAAIAHANEQLSEYIQNGLEPITPQLPKLKALLIPVCLHKMREYILFIFQETLESLRFPYFPALDESFTMNNLTYLNTSASRDEGLRGLSNLQAPIKWLQIRIEGRERAAVSANLLFEAICSFKSTLSILDLELKPDSMFNVDESLLPVNSFLRIPPFTNKFVLEEMTNLKSVRLGDCCPTSFNFLYGLRNNLEYLYLDMTERNSPVKCMRDFFPWKGNDEVIDIMECWRRQLADQDRLNMYESNLWEIFTKLKVLSLKTSERNGKLLKFRRSVYEKLQRDKMKMEDLQI